MKIQNKWKVSQRVINCKGITLLELLVAIAIVGILASIAVPAFDSQIKNSKLKSNASSVVAAYNLARSEAVNRGVQVGVKNIVSGYGWVVFEVATDVEINRFEPDGKGITWNPATLPEVIYNPTGFRTFGSNVETITIEDDRGIGRIITVSAAGSTKVEKI